MEACTWLVPVGLVVLEDGFIGRSKHTGGLVEGGPGDPSRGHPPRVDGFSVVITVYGVEDRWSPCGYGLV